jgi:hypothetical protein
VSRALRTPEARVPEVLRRARDLVRGAPEAARAAAAAIDAAIDAAPVRLVPALDRAFRDPELHAAQGLKFLDVEVADVVRLERLGLATAGALGVLGLVRSGHARQAATQRLAGLHGRTATAFLLNRLNDYVPAVARLAWAGIEARLSPRHAEALVACLPLIERMQAWVRAGARERERLRALLQAPACRAALTAATRDRDPEVCAAACAMLAEVHRGTPEIEGVLAAALASRDPPLRRWAARVALDRDRTPAAAFAALAARMERDRAPAIRLAGLWARAAQGDRAGIVRAAFDPNAGVRHHARVILAGSFGPLDYRGESLAALAGDGGRDAVVAALATLSDFGRREDLAAVARFAEDPRPAVAREARRTLGMLQALP